MNKQDQQVQDYLDKIGVKFTCVYQGQIIKHDWNDQKVNSYRVTFGEYFYSFYQGLGIKEEPTAASVLYCLLFDILIADYSVQEYLDEFEGVDEYDLTVARQEEIKALIEQCGDYRLCLTDTFTTDQIDYLRELLEDY
ncbi:MAG: hypothetical protein GOVbin4162_112 [Prokaryotic dsDNA virus sp.]|nr:MAG: hypothetical protein GOVbin4162_112 [Prokaryotic dsDNA virus sp.]|tara:strand:- start:1578 stop:1991 length:414 start_codon:yes stop_codon:yes gene_type:complete